MHALPSNAASFCPLGRLSFPFFKRGLSFLLTALLGLGIASAQVQTNNPARPPGSTNEFSFVTNRWQMTTNYPAQTNRVGAAETATNNVRSMSLEEAIRLALEHNLDIQIEQYNPLIAEFNLKGAYGAYDPTFNFSAQQSHDSTEGQYIQQFGFTTQGRDSWNERFSGGISGVLPYGTTYDVTGDMNRTSGSSGGVDPVTHQQTIQQQPFQYSGTPTLTLRQPLLRDFWMNAAREQIRVNKKTLQISETTLDQRIMTIITSVENAYYDLIFARENVKVLEKAQQLAAQLLGENKKRVEVGVLAKLDEKQAESQYAASQADLLAGQQTLSMQQNLLKNLLTDDYTTWDGIVINPAETLVAVPYPVNISESRLRALSDRPELIELRQQLERQDIVLSFQRNQLFPALDLTGSYGRNALAGNLDGAFDDIYRGDNPVYSYGIILKVPLSNRTERYRYKVNKAEKKQLLLRYKQQEQTII